MPLLQIQGLTQKFGGLQAVSDFDITLNGGELAGLIGPNGAGKTTIFNLVSGFYQPRKGPSASMARTPAACARIRSRPKAWPAPSRTSAFGTT